MNRDYDFISFNTPDHAAGHGIGSEAWDGEGLYPLANSGGETLMAMMSERRIRAKVAVRLFGMDARNKPFTTTAQTIEIAMNAARLGGVDVSLVVDEVIGVQYEDRKARFRVAAVGAPGTPQSGEVELDCLQPENDIWRGIEESPGKAPAVAEAPKPVIPAPPAVDGQKSGDRRRFRRYMCQIGASVQGGNGNAMWARCTDISRGGCYLETWSPMPVGAMLKLSLEGIEVEAEVTTSHPSVGMGLKFLSTNPPDAIEGLISRFQPDPIPSEKPGQS